MVNPLLDDAPGRRQAHPSFYSPKVGSLRSSSGSLLARSPQQSSGALLDPPVALSGEDRRQDLHWRSANPSPADLIPDHHTLSPELQSRLNIVAQKHASLKRQLSNRGRPTRPKAHASLSAQELSLPPKERWEAMMAITPEDVSPANAENMVLEKEKQDLPAKPTTPRRHVARRSLSSPVVIPVPYSSPAPAHALRRQNSITSQKQDETSPSTTTNGSQIGLARAEESQDIQQRQFVAGSAETSKPDDISTLIAANGSAEAALRKVLEEKQATLARSEQLWQLVERQRAMILDLNKSMERALKEKDRYRQKLKEVLAKDSTSISRSDMMGKLDRSGSIDLDHVPGTPPQVRQIDEMQSSPQTPVRQTKAPPTTMSLRKRNDSLVDSPVSLHQRMESVISDDGSVILMEATPVKISPVTRVTPTTGPRAHAPLTAQEPPRLMMEIPSSPPTGNNRPRSRKGPPTPLNLSAIPKQTEEPTVTEADSYSDSDYDQSPTTPNERGRRRTRADDESRSVASTEDGQIGSGKPQRRAPAVVGPSENINNVNLANELSSPSGIASTGLPASPRPQLTASRPYTSRSDFSSSSTDRPIGQTLLAPLLSPGLPASPRPSDHPAGAPVPVPRPAKTPLSTRTPISDAFMIAGLPLSPSQPNQFLQLPSLGPLDLPSFSSATNVDSVVASRSSSFVDSGSQQGAVRQESSAAPNTDKAEFEPSESVAHPGLLLRPDAIPTIELRVICPKSKSSRNDSPMESKSVQDFGDRFVLEVIRRADQEKLWSIEKTMSGLPALHHSIKASCSFPAMLPQDSPFANEVMSNSAYRQAALAQYFKILLATSLPEAAGLVVCRYLSTNVLDNSASPALSGSDHDSAVSLGPVQSARGTKSGILMRQEPGTAAWRSRLFVLEDHNLHCYHETGGDLLGTIALLGRDIARGMPGNKPDHAFMITNGTPTGIVLRAKNDAERDSWVDTLVACIAAASTKGARETSTLQIPIEQPRKLSSALPAKVPTQTLQAVGYDATVAAQAPTMGSPLQSPSGSNLTLESPMSASAFLASQPVPIRAEALDGSSPISAKSHKRGHSKKRSIFGFRTSKSTDDSSKSRDARSLSRHRPTASKATSSKVVFGAPLAEAAKYFPPRDIDVLLPAPVYRCIEYLESVDAADEEGLFRRTGSNTEIDALKDRFNNEGDVKLVDGEPLDVHTVSSLLKRYLIKLPESVLTESLRFEFHNALEMDNHQSRVTATAALIQRLPEANRELLATLTRFLIGVANNSEKNKMNVKNIAIIFSPTLGHVPNELIVLLLTEYSYLFNDYSYPSAATPSYTSTSTSTSSATATAPSTPLERPSISISSRPGTPTHAARPSGQVWNMNANMMVPSANAWGLPQGSGGAGGYRDVPVESLRSRKGLAR